MLLLCACAGLPLERSIEEDEWLEARAGPFRIVSDLGRGRLLSMAERLRVFDLLARQVLHTDDRDPRVPTLVLALSHAGAYQQMRPPPGTAGVFFGRRRGNFVLVDESRGEAEGESTLYHEYGHFITHNHAQFNYPTWYDEGVAEVLSSTKFGSSSILFARLLPNSLGLLLQQGLMSSESLFTARSTFDIEGRLRQVFYAQAWFTVLYLDYAYSGDAKDGLVDRSAQLKQYLTLYNQGLAEREAFVRAFQISFDELDTELVRFLSRGSIPDLKLKRAAFAGEPPIVRALRPAEAAEALGSALLAGRRDLELAEHLYARAAELEPDAAPLASGLARSRLYLGREEGLSELFERALALAPDDPASQLDYAEFLLVRARKADQDPALARELRARATALLEVVVQRDPRSPEASFLLGIAYQEGGSDPGAALAALRRAHTLLPSDVEAAYSLARCLVGLRQFPEARQLANRALAGSHDPSAMAAVRELLDSIPPDDPPATP